MARGRGRKAKGKDRADAIPSMNDDVHAPQAPTTSTSEPTKKVTIFWDKPPHRAHTSRLIAWCKANEDARIKLFSDSAKDAKEQGRKKKQSGVPKETYYQQLAHAIFSNDEDPQVQLLFQANPQAFIKPVQTRFGT